MPLRVNHEFRDKRPAWTWALVDVRLRPLRYTLAVDGKRRDGRALRAAVEFTQGDRGRFEVANEAAW